MYGHLYKPMHIELHVQNLLARRIIIIVILVKPIEDGEDDNDKMRLRENAGPLLTSVALAPINFLEKRTWLLYANAYMLYVYP